jgi:hypothetical protein
MIMTILSVIAGAGLVELAKGYIFTRKNASIAQQEQITMTRLKKEFSAIKSVSSGSLTSITFTRSDSVGGVVTHTISWAGSNSPLIIDGTDTLIGNVDDFILKYYDSFNSAAVPYSLSTSIIEITLKLKGADDASLTFSDRVVMYLEM